MHDQVPVGEADRLADLAEELQPLADRQPLLVAIARDGHAIDVLHDEVRQPVVGDTAVQQRGDVRVL